LNYNECLADIQTFARLHDLASIPITHALFAEHSDVTDVIMKTPLVGFSELLSNPKANAVLKYFLVSPSHLFSAWAHDRSPTSPLDDLPRVLSTPRSDPERLSSRATSPRTTSRLKLSRHGFKSPSTLLISWTGRTS